jgi:amino acid adenylation domain-containing protein
MIGEVRRSSAHEAESDRRHDEQCIAITGLACRLPGAATPDALWRNLRDGRESIARFDIEELLAEGVPRELLAREEYVPAAAVLEDVDLFDAGLFGFTPREAALLDPQQRLFLECAHEALELACCVPSSFDGAIGVYAGANVSTYLLSCLAGAGRLPTGTEALELLLHNEKDYLSTRTAYKLGLTGPAVTVQSACSTSLVAVHLACQSLLDHECDVAIAGGVSVRVPHRVGYLYEEGLIFSPDGHCRPFDAAANGTVFGSGVGVVVLKRLSDALADRDPIEAVILGSAVNNDGSAKVGYAAPSVAGQTEVIATALGVAGVDPATVGAVEAHGTGTPLGDPIELVALDRALESDTVRSEPCAVSSIKSNVGHLDTAAGIAGLLKAVLQLRNRKLAPNLHFRAPNPIIDRDLPRISINGRLRDWEFDEPLRIGVSSFGIGGTNAHVVLEEAPVRNDPAPDERPQLILVSGNTPEAVDRLSVQLAGRLSENAPPQLADVAYTLQAARTRRRHRRFVLAADVAEAADALLATGSPSNVTIDGRGSRPQLVFMFPGQGAQYSGMGRGLYESAPVFREEIDHSAAILESRFGFDLRDVVFPRLDSEGERAEADERLQQTALAQPALFAVEYALAAQLGHWGLRPDAMIGHSIGELVAACLAGVFDRDEALAVVAVRGRLMQERPTGAMLSVALPAAELEPLLEGAVSLAASNAPVLSVASGPTAAIELLAQQLEKRGVPCRLLHTSHAFHSTSMDDAVVDFRRHLESVSLNEPRLPFASNVTGAWITASEATSPSYWARQLRDPVRFDGGLAAIVADRRCALLEVGPGRVLSTIARQCVGSESPHAVVQSMRAPDVTEDDFERLLRAAGELWSAGVEADWARLHRGARWRVPLPAHPLERSRHWMAAKRVSSTDPDPGLGLGLGLEFELPDLPPSGRSDGGGTRANGAAPRAGLEQEIARIWEEFLGVGTVGRHDDFFELGGHSLMAVTITAALRAGTGCDVELRHMIEHPTVAAMAAALEAAGPANELFKESIEAEIVPDPEHRHDPFPLTELQQAQWIGRAAGLDMGDMAAHVYLETESSTIEHERLLQAWGRLVEHHDMLRAIVLPDGRQQILPHVSDCPVEVLDMTHESLVEAMERVLALRDQMSSEVRDVGTWPLWRLAVVLLPSGRVRVHLSFDLLIADIASLLFGLLSDWRKLYEDPDYRLEPLKLSFRDYVLAEADLRRTARYERSLAFWRQRALELPTAPQLPRVAARGKHSQFIRLTHFIDPVAWEALKSHASSRGVTLSVAVLAAYAGTLATFSSSQHFTLNLTAVNRRPVHPDVSQLVGEFASFSLLEVDARGADSFTTLARDLQSRTWTDLEHRDVSGVRVLRELARARRSGQAAVMPVVFTSMIGYRDDGPSLSAWLGELTHAISQTPQVTLDTMVMEADGGLDISCHAVAGLFPDGFLEEFFVAFTGLLDCLSSERRWDQAPVARLPARQLAQQAAVNNTNGAVPAGLLHEPVLRQAALRPDAPAIISDERVMTFAELAARSLELAALLRESGVDTGSRVGIDLEKGWRQVVAALAVLNAGAAYVPIAPDQPPERRGLIAAQAELSCVLVERSPRDSPAWPCANILSVPDDSGELAENDALAGDQLAKPADVAYVIYTSGSTGTPKGVVVSHRAALNTCVDISERFAVGSGDRVLGISSLAFDLSVFDVFGVLGAGGSLVLPGPADGRDPDCWERLVREHDVTIWNSVPALAQMLVDRMGGNSRPLPLRLALLSGDWIPVPLPEELRLISPRIQVVSLGGATEAAIWSVAYQVTGVSAEWESVPYGTPLRNQRIEVLNERLEPCPTMVTGELHIGGAGLAEGYWNDLPLTAERFITHPVSGERLYRTGDLARFLPDGNVELVGRRDLQIKLAGHRIELGEIEYVLRTHSDVSQAIVVKRGDRHHGRLVAYLTPNGWPENEEAFVEDVLGSAAESLPVHMVPRTAVVLDAMPLSANGKVDRGALPEPDSANGSEEALEAEHAAIADRIAEVVADTLGVQNVGVHDNFFELGGDSIMGVRVIARIAEEGLEVAPQDLFEHQTIAALVRALSDQGRLAGSSRAEVSAPLAAAQSQVFSEIADGHASASLVCLQVGETYDRESVERALAALVSRHDALRLRVTADEPEAAPRRSVVCGDDGSHGESLLQEIDLRDLPDPQQQAVRQNMIEEMASELDVERGPISKAAVIAMRDGTSQFVWLAHRAAVDRASWSLLLCELRDLCVRSSKDVPPALPARATSFIRWDEAGASRRPRRSWLQNAVRPGHVWRQTTVTLSAAETEILGDSLGATYRLGLHDGVLAALTWLLCERDGSASPILAVEVDRRRGAGPIGCCSGVELLHPTVEGADPGTVLIAVKTALLEAHTSATIEPDEGPPETIAGYLRGADLCEWRSSPAAPLAFGADFVGPSDVASVDTLRWSGLELSCAVVDGELRVRCLHDSAEASVVSGMRERLCALADHCRSTEEGQLSTADFPLAGLDEGGLATLLSELATDTGNRG